MNKILLLLLPLVFCISPVHSQNTFIEINGEVAIEAEYYTDNTGAWEEVEGRNAYPIEKSGLGILRSDRIRLVQNREILGSIQDEVTLARTRVGLPLCRPLPSASILAPANEPEDFASLFVYEKGTELSGYRAPERRVVMPGLTARSNRQAKELFIQLVRWASGRTDSGQCLLVASNTGLNENDQVMSTVLSDAGFRIEVVRDEEASSGHAAFKDLVVISESVSSSPLKETFKQVDVPVVVCEPFILDGMGMIDGKDKWFPEPGQIGNAMMNRRGNRDEFLIYGIYFSTPGTYRTHVLAMSGRDSYTRQLFICWDDPSTGRGNLIDLEDQLDWSSQTRGFCVSEPGWHTLYISNGKLPVENPDRRYPHCRIDKICISQSKEKPAGDGPVQSLNCHQIAVPEALTTSHEFLPPQVWMIEDGYAVVEAEDIDHHQDWILSTEPGGFTGKGYLSWEGTDHTRSIEGLGGNDDALFVRMGSQEEWLIIRVFAGEAGEYLVNARNYHEQEDGDNDAWVTLVDFRPYHIDAFDTRVRRMGDSLRDGVGFSWLDWGVRRFPLKQGINNILIGGRSIGFGIDRIALYRADDAGAEQQALDPDVELATRLKNVPQD